MDVRNLLETRAKRNPEKTAIIFKDQNINFLQLKDVSFKLADSLSGLGVEKSTKVAIYLPSSPQYFYSYLAVWSLGGTAVPLDFMLTEDELISCISHSEARVLILKTKANISLDKIKSACPLLKTIITCLDKREGYTSFEELVACGKNIAPKAGIKDKDYSIIFYTSGTTGKPKGVLINYEQLGAPPKSMGFFVDLNEKDIALCALPFSHLGGLIYIQNCISFGITIVLMERFIPLEFIKNIQTYRVTCFWIVPSMYYAFLQLKEFESFDLSSLRWMVTFGASNSPDALKRFHKFCPEAHLLNGWGMTETNAPTVVLPMGSTKIESVGRPLPWVDIKIFDDNSKEVPQGQVGEIVCRGWVVTDGYYKDPETTKQTIRNNWFYTGDLGRFDEEGHLYIVGRKKEMIKVGGEIVFEPEVEAAIQKHPDIAEAAVVGINDKLRGEVPKAFVVLKENKSLQEEDLRYFLRQHLAHFKIPHYFEFKLALPKNRTGKIDKELLRK
ncbi:MAG: AMP-binding protein [Candidatus Omnitrophica bacterium]|nr:AMP-binding protein [Candidatus Omnitrophota bacterium]